MNQYHKSKKCTLKDVRKRPPKRPKILKYSKYLQGLDKDIQEMGFEEKELECFRIGHDPMSINDALPQKFFPERKVPKPLPPVFWEQQEQKDKRKYISSCTLSHFRTEEECMKMYNDRFEKDLLNMDRKKAIAKKKKFGTHIIKMKYKKGDGLFSPTGPSGHIELLEYEGLDIRDRTDKSYKAKVIFEEDYEENANSH